MCLQHLKTYGTAQGSRASWIAATSVYVVGYRIFKAAATDNLTLVDGFCLAHGAPTLKLFFKQVSNFGSVKIYFNLFYNSLNQPISLLMDASIPNTAATRRLYSGM